MKMAEYTLMNKNHPVVSFRYDRDIHAVVKIVDVHDLRYAPVALADSKGIVTRRALNDWWRRRAIPPSRHQIQQLLDSLNLNSTLELAEENFGLSLSDRYWINDSKNPLKWEDVNFFDNDFTDDLGMLTLGQESSGNPNLMSPNSTLGGDLNKKWKIVNGTRFLVKGGTGSTRQEVLNEVVATALYNRLLSRNDYVPYFLFEENGRIYSACENMLGQDEELVTAYDVLSTRKKPDSISDYDFLVDTYKSLGLKNVEEGLAKMFTCDYILANQDRHWRNFGVIRNVETLEFTRLAPIFDNGTSLWCHAYNILAEDISRNRLDRKVWLRTSSSAFSEITAGSIGTSLSVSLLRQRRSCPMGTMVSGLDLMLSKVASNETSAVFNDILKSWQSGKRNHCVSSELTLPVVETRGFTTVLIRFCRYRG